MESNGLSKMFWSRVDRQTGPDVCWPWMLSCDRDGYGQWWYKGVKFKAHRLAYSITYGDIPDGCMVLHSCDNPVCCNPAHLRVGTHTDNMQDRNGRGRTVSGAHHGRAKLNPEEVVAIRSASGTLKSIAEKYGISFQQVSRIRLGQRYLNTDSPLVTT